MEFVEFLNRHQCVVVRIEMTKGLPVTVGKEYRRDKKDIPTVNLADFVNVEDLPALTTKVEELSAAGSGSLRVECRFAPSDTRYLICGQMRREKSWSKTHDYLYGVVADVSEFHKGEMNDAVREEKSTKKDAEKIARDNTGIADVVGLEQLIRIQAPLVECGGVFSAMFDENNKLICTSDPAQTSFDADKFEYTKQIPISINYILSAVWVIASDDEARLAKCEPVHELLADVLSKSANASVMLHKEMVNNERANKLLSETIEQQMLLNSIYTKVLNENNSIETMRAVVDMTGDYLKLDRIAICEDTPESNGFKMIHEWMATPDSAGAAGEFNPLIKKFKYADYPELIEELKHYETYFSSNPEHDVLGMKFTSYVASNLNGDGGKFGIIVYVVDNHERVLSHAEKRLLRSVSQIIAAVIMRCKDNESLKNLNWSLENSNRLLREHAYYDTKLRIKNRISLENDLAAELEAENLGSLVAFKIPALKDFNNFAGAEYSLELAKEILASVSSYEKASVEPYRFSDEVFMLLVRGISPIEVEVFCNELTQRFEKPWSLTFTENDEHYFEITAGVASYPESGRTVDALFRAATISMQKAKEFGSNSFAFYSETLENIETENYDCAQALRNAVKNNMEGLTIKYTPVYALVKDSEFPGEKRRRRLISCVASPAISENILSDGAESPPPRVLMRVAEKMGIDGAIANWVVTRACEFCKLMRGKAHGTESELTVSVCATARSLASGKIVNTLKNALRETALPPDGLVVRFTERIVAMNYDRFIPILAKLKKLGVLVVIDNVGAYYNLAVLTRHSAISGGIADVTLFTGEMDDFAKEYIANIICNAKAHDVKVGVKSVENEEQLVLAAMAEADWYQASYRTGSMTAAEVLTQLTGE
jgi:EAL domain-containing protein (putative c-di-GMP-specific phosphodiesterase class I)/GGDEF domain-containing protein